ncbi:MAG: methyltransferase domain-containing protein [Acidobacteriota bacterium]
MRRIIEEAVEKRKKKQKEIQEILLELGGLIEHRSVFKKSGTKASEILSQFNTKLNELITLQDQEWDHLSNNHYNSVFTSLQGQIDKLDAKYSNIQTLINNFRDLENSLEDLAGSFSKEQPEKEKFNELKEKISPFQYSDFEKRFRGSREKIKENLKKYIPYFKDSRDLLDIGCGRGEFIQLLKDEGINAKGIDNSDSMLKEAKEKGLNCIKADAFEYLKKQEKNSTGGIFSSQVIEHFEPEYLKKIVNESYRILEPGSILILETINPLSLFALTNIFYLDITHQKPLHPEFMRYMFESAGFSKVEIIYSEPLHTHFLEEISPDKESAREFNSNVDKLNKMLFNSPEYAVSGTK